MDKKENALYGFVLYVERLAVTKLVLSQHGRRIQLMNFGRWKIFKTSAKHLLRALTNHTKHCCIINFKINYVGPTWGHLGVKLGSSWDHMNLNLNEFENT